MGRLLRVLIPLVLVTAAVAGCIGGDDELENGTSPTDGEDQNGNVTNGDNGNMTVAPPPSPVPDIQVSMIVEDEEPTTGPFIAKPGTALDFELDGSGSSVENGVIEVYSWIVVRPDGDQLTGSGAESSFEVSIDGTSTSDYGVYTATLRVLSDANVLEATTVQWVLSYRNHYEQELMMIGPSDGCDGNLPQLQASGALGDTPFVRGTYGLHTASTAENITSLNIKLDFSSTDTTADMAIYVFAPSTGDPEGDCSEAIASSDYGNGPIELTVDGLTETGAYRIQAQLNGVLIDNYEMTVEALYAIPGADDGADEDDDEEEYEEE